MPLDHVDQVAELLLHALALVTRQLHNKTSPFGYPNPLFNSPEQSAEISISALEQQQQQDQQ
jgi:hypothetical protein